MNKITGMDITIVTSANTDKEAFELLKEFGLPFKNKKMAKESMKARELKRQKLVKNIEKRAALKAAGDYEGLQNFKKCVAC